MTMTYEAMASFAQTWGLIYFALIFLGVVAYAYAPRNRSRFDDAARQVLRDEDRP